MLLCATLVRSDPPANLVLVDAKGRIRFITTDLATRLGASPEGLARQPVSDLMPQPWNCLHSTHLFKEAEASMAAVGVAISGDMAAHSGLHAVHSVSTHGHQGQGHHGHGQHGHGHNAHHGHHGHHGHGSHGHHGHGHTRNSIADAVHLAASQSQRHSSTGGKPTGGFVPGSGAGNLGAGAGGSNVIAGPPGSCLAGATVILGSSSKVQNYYKVQVRRPEGACRPPMAVYCPYLCSA